LMKIMYLCLDVWNVSYCFLDCRDRAPLGLD
jgi:hypothetical protein